MASRQGGILGDPETTIEYTCKPRSLQIALIMPVNLLFIAMGFGIMAIPGTGLPEKAMGAFTVVFFAWLGVLTVQRVGKIEPVRLTREGLWFGPRDKRKHIHWSDIDGLLITKIRSNRHNVIQLRDLCSVVSQYDEAEGRATIKVAKTMRLASGALIPLALANREFDVGELGAIAAGKFDSIEQVLLFNRIYFGGEILLTWADRDRNARKFHALLEAWQHKYG